MSVHTSFKSFSLFGILKLMANINKMNIFFCSFQVLKAGRTNTVKLEKSPALDYKILGQRVNEHKQIN